MKTLLYVLYVNLQYNRWKGDGPIQCQWNKPTCSLFRASYSTKKFIRRLCDSISTNGISVSHGYDYVQWWNVPNTYVIAIIFLFIPPRRQSHMWPKHVAGYQSFLPTNAQVIVLKNCILIHIKITPTLLNKDRPT